MVKSTHKVASPGTRREFCPAQAPLAALIQRVLPGNSQAVKDVRRRVLEFCANPAARTALLRGPIGSGKSSIARLIAFGRRIAPLREEDAVRQVNDLRFEGPGLIDLKLMSWYLELTVTGLVDSLVSAQLFGVAKGAATSVSERPGVFEAAQTGRAGSPDSGAAVTGGVVFLDEIADITPEMQTRLLPVLSGAPFYRVGGEGNKKYQIAYEGVTITATWKNIGPDSMRQDLLSRISSTIIDVPSLTERVDDLPLLIDAMQEAISRRQTARLEEMTIKEPAVDRGFWTKRIEGTARVNQQVVDALAKVDWSKLGELRALSNVLEMVTIGCRDVEEVLQELPVITQGAQGDRSAAPAFADELLSHQPSSGSLVNHVRAIELRQRADLKVEILRSHSLSRRLAALLRIPEEKLRRQARQLDRTRPTVRAENSDD